MKTDEIKELLYEYKSMVLKRFNAKIDDIEYARKYVDKCNDIDIAIYSLSQPDSECEGCKHIGRNLAHSNRCIYCSRYRARDDLYEI